jgi:hypothetical protein
VFSFYTGGDTPHIWTDAQIAQLTSRWVLPNFTYSDPNADADTAISAYLSWLHSHKWDLGAAVAIDTESVAMPLQVQRWNDAITGAGWKLIEYESKGPMGHNPLTSGGRWVADWNGIPHLYPGSVATQYASADMAGRPWDSSLIDSGVVLHQLHPPVTHNPSVQVFPVTLPDLVRNDTGPAVKRMQSLLLAHDPGALPAWHDDGIWGPETDAAVRAFQRYFGITTDPGTCAEPTWQRLIEG